ncbi:hypothetical protein D3C72_1749860 [compost metagenome]
MANPREDIGNHAVFHHRAPADDGERKDQGPEAQPGGRRDQGFVMHIQRDRDPVLQEPRQYLLPRWRGTDRDQHCLARCGAEQANRPQIGRIDAIGNLAWPVVKEASHGWPAAQRLFVQIIVELYPKAAGAGDHDGRDGRRIKKWHGWLNAGKTKLRPMIVADGG